MISKILLLALVSVLISIFHVVETGRVAAASAASVDVRIDKLELSKTVVIRPCALGIRPSGEGCSDDRTIRVKATVAGRDVKNARVDVIVSGGRANRVGPLEFDWDLSGAMAGTYTITAAAVEKDGRVTESKTATATVKECDSCVHVDVCPVIKVDGPDRALNVGEQLTFTASVGGSVDATYNWTVSAGTIVSGQGTRSINVATDRSVAGTSLTATVEISGNSWMPACSTTASDSVIFELWPTARLVDEFRTAGNNCEEGFARLDSFLIELNINPNDQGVIVIYSDTAEPDSGRRRKLSLTNYIKMRQFDQTRLTFTDASLMKDAKTQFWLVTAGADMPTPEAGDGPIDTPKEAKPPTKPYMYAAEYSDGIPGCFGNLYDLKEYAAELNASPKSRGKIVIAETSQAKFAQKRREILRDLAKFGVTAGRITSVFKPVRRDRALESTELWVVPNAK
ncbi:MAG: hypothetical protein KA956_09600 [Pyrinomonadaceae bacterium]|nr:hypothetical protein [Acidobacteriota bacterium]MBP7376718.1 hypothetical protein [Pyrinomonadaceae bacterium]